VYGAPLPVGAQIGIILGLTALIIGVLILSYFWYLRTRILQAKAKEAEDEKVRVEAEREAAQESEPQLWKEKYE
jgi:Tfp pilus assembly protein PilO